MRVRKETCETKKKKIKRKKKKNKLKVAPTTTRNDKQRKKNEGKKYFCVFVWNKYVIIKQVRENQDEVHEVCPIDQVKWLMEHKDI